MTSATRSLTPAYLPYLPHSVLKLLDEAERLSAAGLPITFDQLPAVSDLEAGVRACAAKVGEATEAHAKRCFARLVTTFDAATKQGEKEMRLRFGAFFDACKDMPDDLWEKATAYCVQELKWMPKPAEFREQVKAELDQRRIRLRRSTDMLDAARKAPPPKFVPEHPDVRDAALIESWRKVGRYDKANAVEERMAARQNRPPVLVPDPSVAREGLPPKPAPAPRNPAPTITDVPDWTAEEVPMTAYGEME